LPKEELTSLERSKVTLVGSTINIISLIQRPNTPIWARNAPKPSLQIAAHQLKITSGESRYSPAK
jgi:hypothetical protein